jgi:hypothetical protein
MARSESFTNRPNTLSQANPSHRISCLQSGGGPYIAMGVSLNTPPAPLGFYPGAVLLIGRERVPKRKVRP